MKRQQLWVWGILAPVVLFWAFALVIVDRGDDGILESDLLRRSVYPALSRLSGPYTDAKFRARGPRSVKEKIVIVEIDDRSIDELPLGRWPWHRDAAAVLVMSVLDHGAKAVGLDIVFANEDKRVPEELSQLLIENEVLDPAEFESDLVLKRIIDLYKDRLVLGWMTDTTCSPANGDDGCNVNDPALGELLPEGFDKFGYDKFTDGGSFHFAKTAILSAPTVIANRDIYNASAVYGGFLVSGVQGTDDVVRRAQLVIFVDGKPYPSLPLVMASVGLGKPMELALDGEGLVKRIGFEGDSKSIPVSPTGAMAINFRGPGYHFGYVSAYDLFMEEPEIPIQHDGKVEVLPLDEIFKDAYVLLGVSAIGARDLRSFPFGSNTPGTEGLATILDNILSHDPIVSSRGIWGSGLLLILMTVGALLFSLAMLRLSALPAVLVALACIGVLVAVDIYYVFGSLDVNLNSAFLLAELSTIFIVTVSMKYIIEERGKKVIRGTFAKYLAPAVVDEMLKDPENLKLGGEARELTIMMSDLRGFTATAERLEAAEVLEMLNHYLGTMADIIVDFEGTIDEFIGDAILTIFGAPIAKPDDARRAVACCLAMQKAMKEVNARNIAKGLPELEMGIALNTGEVTVGNIGSQRRLKYGVVGSHVNLTARIESNTVGGQLLISESTLKLAGEDIKIGETYSIVAKGFPKPIVAYEILGIGGEFDIYLEELDLALVELEKPLDVVYRIMKSKNDEGEEVKARFQSASPFGAMIECDEELKALSNIKMQIRPADGEGPEGDVYAKVVTGGTLAKLRFTSVAPPALAYLTKLCGGEDKGESSADLIDR